jgi:hypothetical protein
MSYGSDALIAYRLGEVTATVIRMRAMAVEHGDVDLADRLGVLFENVCGVVDFINDRQEATP